MSISYCPDCGQQVLNTIGFACGYGGLGGCMNKPTVYKNVPIVDPQFPDRIAYTTVRYDPAKDCIMCDVYHQQLLRERTLRNDLYECLEYEKLKNHAYAMLWSAREYLRHLAELEGAQPDPETHASYRASDHARSILNAAMSRHDADEVDGKGIKDKYTKYFTKEWAKGWRAADLIFIAPTNAEWKGPIC